MIRLDEVSKRFYIESKNPRGFWDILLDRPEKVSQLRIIRAVENVTLQVREGEILGVVGRNGAGKTTLLNMISGLSAPTSGRISVAGEVAAMLSLETQFNPELTGRENVFHHFNLKGFPEQEIEGLAGEAIDFCELGEAIDRPFRTYSTGMKARLAFSCVTAVTPEILLVDETLSVGDANFAQKGFDRLRALIAAGKTVIMVSHDLDAVKMLSNRVIWIHQGAVAMDGDPEEVIQAYRRRVHEEEEKTLVAKIRGRRFDGVSNRDALSLETPTLHKKGAKGPSLLFETFDEVTVRAPFRLGRSLPGSRFRLQLVRADGLPILDNDSAMDGLAWDGAAREGFLEIDLGALPFNNGFFHLTLEAVDGDGRALARTETAFKVVRPFPDSDQPVFYPLTPLERLDDQGASRTTNDVL